MLIPLFDLNPHSRFPWFTLLLIAANVGINVWSGTLGEVRQTAVVLEHGFVPVRFSQLDSGKPVIIPLQSIDPRTGKPEIDLLTGRPKIVGVPLSTDASAVYPTFLSTMFLHGSWAHLLMNMWMLWIFGNNVEDRLGHFLYLAFYIGGGIIATLVFWVTDVGGTVPVIGASGAVAAVLGGYAVTYPTAKVRTLIFIVIIFLIRDVPALVLLGLWFLMEVISGMIGLWGVQLQPVAFWAHVGGFLAGMLLMPVLSLGASPPGTNWREEAEEMFRF